MTSKDDKNIKLMKEVEVGAASSAAASPAAPLVEHAVAESIISAAQVAVVAIEEKISFDQWWMMINKKLKLQAHMKEILHVDFKARGLLKLELKQKFDEAMKLFGYKI